MNSEETLEQLSDRELLLRLVKEVAGINKRLGELEKSAGAQFEAIRQGLVQNSAAFDRLESVVYIVRSDISNLKADVKDLTEELHQTQKVITKDTLVFEK